MPGQKRRELVDQLRNMNDQELTAELTKQREQLFNLRRNNVTRQLENTAQIPATRKTIARILTLMGERSIAAEGGNR